MKKKRKIEIGNKVNKKTERYKRSIKRVREVLRNTLESEFKSNRILPGERERNPINGCYPALRQFWKLTGSGSTRNTSAPP